MKSPPPETRPPNTEEEKSMEANQPPATKEQAQSENEKDSGYYDSSSESLSSEETPPSTSNSVTTTTSEAPQTQTAYTPIYILQNVVLKQPRIVLLQPPIRRHRKRASPSSYLPILRSYPKIAPRIAPPSPASDHPKDTDHSPSASKVCKQPAPQLLDVSLRSLALLRRTRETQRSIRELRAHARLYDRALRGEEGGWERLRRAMERSGGYRKVPPPISLDSTEEAMNTTEASSTTTDDSTPAAEKPETPIEEMTSPEDSMTSSDATASRDNDTGGAV